MLKKLLVGSAVLGALFVFPAAVAAVDSDKDGLSDAEEARYYTDAYNADTDGDGYEDGLEVMKGYTPHAGDGARMHEYDYDGDGLNDWLEGWFGSDRGVADTDEDGHSDFDEVMHAYHPTSATSTRFDRKITVDRTNQRLYYFVDGVKIANLPVSTGNPGSQTPAGVYEIERMIPKKRYRGPGYDLPGVTWNMQFKPMYYIHAAYWHNDFGVRTHSHGCVNLREDDAAFLYKYMDLGVPVEVVGDTPKGFVVGT